MSILLINAEANSLPMADKSVHMIASSPPYYGLRDYGLPKTAWPGVEYAPMPGLPSVAVPAWTGCLGLEPDPIMFVGHIVHIMREGWRVLRDDGTAWLNFGDSYSGGGRGGNGDAITGRGKNASQLHHTVPSGLKTKDLMGIPWRVAFALQADGWYLRSDVIWSKPNPMPESVDGWRWVRHQLKVKNGRVARHGIERGSGHVNESNVSSRNDGASWENCPGCAACAPNGGYILRKGSWRPTKSHEYIFMLTKSDKYYCDKDAVAETAVNSGGGPFSTAYANSQPAHGGESQYRRAARDSFKRNGSKRAQVIPGQNMGTHREDREESSWDTTKRNRRTVWTVPPMSYAGAHFATWPPDLVEPMIKAGTSERGVCPTCGAPWVRVVHKHAPEMRPDNPNPVLPYDPALAGCNGRNNTTLHMTRRTETLNWRQSCDCKHDFVCSPCEGLGGGGYGDCLVCDGSGKVHIAPKPVPAVVLDIFVGSGTTVQVARKLGRHGIGVDLSLNYLQNEARDRLSLNMFDEFTKGTGVTDGRDYSDLFTKETS